MLRRLDCVLAPTKAAVLEEQAKRSKAGVDPEPFLLKKSGQSFYNTSPLDLKKVVGDEDHIGENLRGYLQGFSPSVRDIFERFEFHAQIDRLTRSGLLYLVTEKFANIDILTMIADLSKEMAESHALSNDLRGKKSRPVSCETQLAR